MKIKKYKKCDIYIYKIEFKYYFFEANKKDFNKFSCYYY